MTYDTLTAHVVGPLNTAVLDVPSIHPVCPTCWIEHHLDADCV